MTKIKYFIFLVIGWPFSAVFADAEKDKAAIKNAQGMIDKIVPEEAVKTINLSGMVGNAISVSLGILGTVSLIIFIYSGIMWMTAGGNGEKVTKAQKSMIWAALGIFVVFISYIMVQYVIEGVNPFAT